VSSCGDAWSNPFDGCRSTQAFYLSKGGSHMKKEKTIIRNEFHPLKKMDKVRPPVTKTELLYDEIRHCLLVDDKGNPERAFKNISELLKQFRPDLINKINDIKKNKKLMGGIEEISEVSERISWLELDKERLDFEMERLSELISEKANKLTESLMAIVGVKNTAKD
jgi:hypothetical protein